MKSLTLFGVVGVLILNFAVAQTANPFLGTWKVTWPGQNRTLEGELIVTASGGSWKTFATARGNPCVGREVPIAIESSSAEDATIKLKFSEAITGCADATLKLKRIDANSATGTRGDAELTLTKK